MAGDVMEVTGDRFARGGVKIARRLVGKNEGGIVEKGARYDQSLLLAARKFVGLLIVFVGHAHALEHLVDALVDGGTVGPAGSAEHEAQIVLGTAVGEQTEVLEDYAYLTTQVGNVGPTYGTQVIVEHARAARGHGHVGIERLEQTRLAAAHLADDVDKLALPYPQVYVLEGYERVAVDGYIPIVDYC